MPGPANWFAEVGRFLGGWPDDYLSIDFETNGGAPEQETTLPVEAGWTLVERRRPVLRGSAYLDWTRPRYDVPASWLAQTMDRTRYHMGQSGKAYRPTVALLKSEGEDPREVLETLHNLIAEAVDQEYPILGHNLVYFDLPLLGRTLGEFAGRSLGVPPELTVDTMLIEKSRGNKKVPPRPGTMTRAAYWADCRKGSRVTCNLDTHCVAAYNLDIDHDQAHTAGYDTYVVHLLLEAMRTLSERAVEAA